MDDAQKKRVATSRRDAANEAGLMWSWLFILLFCVILFSDVAAIFWRWHIHPYVFSAVFAVIISGLIAKIYQVKAGAEIAKAQYECNELMKRTKARVQRQSLAKLDKIKAQEPPKKED